MTTDSSAVCLSWTLAEVLLPVMNVGWSAVACHEHWLKYCCLSCKLFAVPLLVMNIHWCTVVYHGGWLQWRCLSWQLTDCSDVVCHGNWVQWRCLSWQLTAVTLSVMETDLQWRCLSCQLNAVPLSVITTECSTVVCHTVLLPIMTLDRNVVMSLCLSREIDVNVVACHESLEPVSCTRDAESESALMSQKPTGLYSTYYYDRFIKATYVRSGGHCYFSRV